MESRITQCFCETLHSQEVLLLLNQVKNCNTGLLDTNDTVEHVNNVVHTCTKAIQFVVDPLFLRLIAHTSTAQSCKTASDECIIF